MPDALEFPTPTWDEWQAKAGDGGSRDSLDGPPAWAPDGLPLPRVCRSTDVTASGPVVGCKPLRSIARVLETDPPSVYEWREALAAGHDFVSLFLTSQSGDPERGIDLDRALEGLPDDQLIVECGSVSEVQRCVAHAAGTQRAYRIAPDLGEFHGLSSWAYSPAQELAAAISHAIWFLRGCPPPGGAGPAAALAQDERAQRLCLSLFVGTNVLAEAAKLRAARILWANVLRGFTLDETTAAFLCAESSPWPLTRLDQQTNLLRTTLQGFAAVVGGADGIALAGRDAPRAHFGTGESYRLADNQLRLLREESFLDRVGDPLAGAFAIEALTEQIATQAWKLVQIVESAGGFAQCATEDTLLEKLGVHATLSLRETVVHLRTRPVVGVSRFADPPVTGEEGEEPFEEELDEELEIDADTLAAIEMDLASEHLEDEPTQDVWLPTRAAEAFEDLHEALNFHALTRARRPEVLLLPLGPVKQRRLRADFAADLFRAGGFAVHDPQGLRDVASALALIHEREPEIVVVCGADAEYAEAVPQIAAGLPERERRTLLYVAGRSQDVLDGADVSDFVYPGLDATWILENAHQHLDVRPVE